MKVRELREALRRVKNQDAEVVVLDKQADIEAIGIVTAEMEGGEKDARCILIVEEWPGL